MDLSAEPATKRQRREPAWKAGFVDPSKLRDLRDGTEAADTTARQQQQQQQQQPAASSPTPVPDAAEDEEAQVIQTRLLDSNAVELAVMYKGRFYRGVLERTMLPQGVGVAAPVASEEFGRVGQGESTNNMCALCNTPLDIPPVTGMSDDKVGMFLKVRLTSHWTARVHLQCAVWCPECKQDPHTPGFYHHMGTAVRRGRALRCKECNERGATVGCFQEGCPAVYHLSCAVNAGCAFDEATKEVWCPMHL